MTPRIGYILLEFPRRSETFILNELIALEPYGIPSVVFSLQKPAEAGISLPDSLARKVEYVDAAVAPDAGEDEKSRLAAAGAEYISLRARELNLQHLHCHYATLPTTTGIMVQNETGIPFSFTGHAKDIFTMRPEKLEKRLHKAKFAITCSKAGKSWLTGVSKAGSEIHCIYHGIYPHLWQVERCPSSSPLFLSVGRLTPKKGFDILVKAAAIVLGSHPDAKFEIIGDGHERETLRRLIDDFGVGKNVQLAGWMGQEQLRARFAAATALVHPGIVLASNNQDGVANVILEAMAAGVPVIVSDLPAITEVVEHEQTGLTFRAGDDVALAGQIEKVIRDQELAERLGNEGRKLASGMTCDEAARKLRELFVSHVG